MRELGKVLRLVRESLELKQEEVAAKAGVSQTQVSRLERGTLKKPPMEDLVKIGQVLGLTPNEIATLAGWWMSSPLERERVVIEITRRMMQRR
jgi:transcriptional regulator with XRE-family HTH domain